MLKHFTEDTGQGYWPIIGWFGFVPLFKDRGYIIYIKLAFFQIDGSLPVSRDFWKINFRIGASSL